MFRRDEWQWTFCGFQSPQDGRPVQKWYALLPPTHKIEVASMFAYLGNLTATVWGRPFFDPLAGEGGISEIIVPDFRDDLGVAYYSIYGCDGPGKQVYTFLHATNKRARNDKIGKAIAKRRLRQLHDGNATIHKFDFEEHLVVEFTKGSGREN